MVSGEEIRLSGQGSGESPVSGWLNGATAGQNPQEQTEPSEETIQETTEQEATPEGAETQPEEAGQESSAGSGRSSGASGVEESSEGEEPASDETADPVEAEDETGEAEGLDVPERISKEKDAQGETGTEQPWGISVDTGNGWLWGGLALVVLLLGCAAADYIRRNLKKKKRRAVASAAYASGGSIAVADYQDIGAREDQQDSHEYSHPELYAQQGVMAVVADGMGGLANGKAVSSALVRTFIDGFPQVSGYYSQTADILLDLSIRANARINQMLRGADRSGSTLVAALVRDGFLYFLTVGDSRIYLYRGGAMLQLNREHIYQEELAVRAVNQTVSMAQVRSDRQAHSLTSYFGIGRLPCIDRNDEGIRLLPGDRILLASDGVFGTLSREQMEQSLRHQDLQESADQMGQMIRAADKPYQDNNTLVVLEYRG